MGDATNIVLSKDNTKAYVTSSHGGLIVFNIKNSANPTEINEYDNIGYCKGVALSKDETKAYVGGDGGLMIIDFNLFN